MEKVKKHLKHISWGLAALYVALGLLLIFLLKGQVALGMVRTGNEFFGGTLPYNLGIAEVFYETALSIDPNVALAWHQRARISFLNGDFDTALKSIDTQIQLHGDSFVASYYIRGLIYGYQSNYSKAEENFLYYLTKNPYSWAGSNDLAWIYFSQGKFKEAADQTEKILQGNPNNPWILLSHAMSMYNLGDTKTALRDLLHAREEAAKLTEQQWSHAYPGNDPAIAPLGLAEFRQTIEKDIELVHSSTVTQ